MTPDTDAIAHYEIRQLSAEAQGLILHRLRNSLAIISGNLSLLMLPNGWAAPPVDSRIVKAHEACKRLDREITELFGKETP